MSIDIDSCLKSMMSLASLEPSLVYKKHEPPLSPTNTKEAIKAYFSTQPEEYLHELEAFTQLNKVNPAASCFVFVVCYNELANLPHMIDLYANQKGGVNFQVVFLINYTVREKVEKNIYDEDIFIKSAKYLLEMKERYSFIHIVTKRFSSHAGGLSRARKYAMDYSLLSCAKSHNPDACVLISNEGDTLKIDSNYLYLYSQRIGAGLECFIQGKVAYPKDIFRAPLLQLYVDIRERVHIGQGQLEHRYPGFEGVMPIGRNYGVHPKIACLSGGIDPIARKGAEDDQLFGFDIYSLSGSDVKYYAEDIVLITHPRREILIVHGLLGGGSDDAKSMYENFHGRSDIYDHTWDTYINLINRIGQFEDNQKNRCLVVNQFYQWVMRTVLKNYFWIDPDIQRMVAESRSHRVGYWERESKLVDIYHSKLNEIPFIDREKFLTFVVNESLGFFNELISNLAFFNKAGVDIHSELTE